MNTRINCPVCGYQDIESNICPNCDTDLSLIRQLQELPQVEKTLRPGKFNAWTLGVAVLMLIIGVGLGVASSFMIMQPRNATISAPHSPVINSIKSPTNKSTPQLNTYIVKPGDNLSLIASKLCGQGIAWEIIVKANPELEKRENYYIDPGEKLKIPNCQEKTE